MPIYEYKCRACYKINELLMGVIDGNIELKCQYCGSKELDKIFSKANVSKSRQSDISKCSDSSCANYGCCHKKEG